MVMKKVTVHVRQSVQQGRMEVALRPALVVRLAVISTKITISVIPVVRTAQADLETTESVIL